MQGKLSTGKRMSDILKNRLLTAFLSAMSITVSFGLAFYWSLEKPFWSGFTAMVISLSTIGQSAQKALLRIYGSAVGAFMGLLLLSLAEQHHWMLLSLLFIYISFMILFMVVSKYNSYFFYTSAIVGLIIILGSLHNNLSPFQYAIARMEETVLGIAVYSFLALLFWPRSSLDSLRSGLRQLAVMHQQIFQAQLTSISNPDTPFELQLYANGIRMLKSSQSLLPAARLENYQVRKQHQEWTSLFRYSSELLQSQNTLTNLLQHFSIEEIHALFPRFREECALLGLQYDNLARQQDVDAAPRNPTLTLDTAALESLNILDQHVVHSIIHEYERQMECCTALNEYIRFVTEQDAPQPRQRPQEVEPAQDLLTLKQLEQFIRGAVIYWSSILLWMYVDPPGVPSVTFVEMTIVMGLVGIMSGDLPPLQIIWSFFAGCLLAAGVYFGIMPMLHGFAELGVLLFGLSFIISFRYYLPAHGLIRTGLLMPVFALTGLNNAKTFDPAMFFTGALSLMLCAVLLALVYYIFAGAHPARRLFVRQRRFLYAASRYLAYLADYPASHRSRIRRMAAAWHIREIRDLPQSLLDLAFAFEEKERGLAHQSVKQVALNAHALSRRLQTLNTLKDASGATQALSLLPEEASPGRSLRQRLSGLWQPQGMELQLRGLHTFSRKLELRLGLADSSKDLLTETAPAETRAPGRELPQQWRKAYIGLLNALHNTVGSAEKVDWNTVNVLEF